jgi:isoleucyl-tRNA synthetase
VVTLDTSLTDDLLDEGRARDLVRFIQQSRRDLGLRVTDRIVVDVAGDDPVTRALEAHRDWTAEQVLATEIVWVGSDDPAIEDPSGGWASTTLADGFSVSVRIKRSA